MKRLMSPSKWLLVFLGMAFLSFPQYTDSAEFETATAAACRANPSSSTGLAFVVCMGGALSIAEFNKCISGGDCFGDNNEIRKILRSLGLDNCEGIGRIFGVRCPDSYGPGVIRINNETGGDVTFYYSQRGDAESVTLPPNYHVDLEESWVNYRHNGPPVVGLRIRNGLTYKLIGNSSRPRLVCAIPRVGSGASLINDPADPCN